MAMTELGNGLFDAGHHEDALSVGEAEWLWRGASGTSGSISPYRPILRVRMQRLEQALRIERDVYRGRLKLGEENRATLLAANNYASTQSAEKASDAQIVPWRDAFSERVIVSCSR